MKKILFAVALGATIISTQAFAQDGGSEGRQLTRRDAQAMADSMFQRFDLNHDGVVTRDEAQQALAQFTQGASGKRADKAGKMLDRFFGTSQSVSQQQFEAVSLARFDRDDLNHDGVVTPAERAQARAQLKADRAQKPGQ
jgi:hypothetical protein